LLLGKHLLQLRQSKIGPFFNRSQQARFGGRIHTTDRAMTLLDSIRVSTPPLLPVDLLHPAKTHPKQLRQLKLRTFARRISCHDLPP
jgi:hypothetical protein